MSMSNEISVVALRPEFAGLTDYVPPYFAVDVQAYMDCMNAIVAAEELGHPMPLLARWQAFGRLRLLSNTLCDLYDKAYADIERDEAKAQATALESEPSHPEFAATMTAAIWDRNARAYARRIIEAALSEDEAAS
jgi:hypothetical protein